MQPFDLRRDRRGRKVLELTVMGVKAIAGGNRGMESPEPVEVDIDEAGKRSRRSRRSGVGGRNAQNQPRAKDHACCKWSVHACSLNQNEMPVPRCRRRKDAALQSGGSN